LHEFETQHKVLDLRGLSSNLLDFDLPVLIAEDKVGVEAQESVSLRQYHEVHERALNSQNINVLDNPDCNIRRSISDSADRHWSWFSNPYSYLSFFEQGGKYKPPRSTSLSEDEQPIIDDLETSWCGCTKIFVPALDLGLASGTAT